MAERPRQGTCRSPLRRGPGRGIVGIPVRAPKPGENVDSWLWPGNGGVVAGAAGKPRGGYRASPGRAHHVVRGREKGRRCLGSGGTRRRYGCCGPRRSASGARRCRCRRPSRARGHATRGPRRGQGRRSCSPCAGACRPQGRRPRAGCREYRGISTSADENPANRSVTCHCRSRSRPKRYGRAGAESTSSSW
jgi:hypothetical protein